MMKIFLERNELHTLVIRIFYRVSSLFIYFYIALKTVARCTSIIQGKDYLGGDMDVNQPAQVRSPAACAALCEEYPNCNYWTLDTRNGNCFIKTKQPATLQTLSFTYTGACTKSP